jgi:hypothetical protein
MLKLRTHSGFHDLFLKQWLPLVRVENDAYYLPLKSLLKYLWFSYYLQIFHKFSIKMQLYTKHILASVIYFDSDMSKSTNTVVYFVWKTVIYIYVCGKCRTQFMHYLPLKSLLKYLWFSYYLQIFHKFSIKMQLHFFQQNLTVF